MKSHSSGEVEQHEHVVGTEHYHGVSTKQFQEDSPSRGDPRYGSHDANLSGFKKALKLSRRPLPILFGDGRYPEEVTRPGKRQNLKALQAQDFKTLYQIVRSKVKRESIQDDKTMIMERTIQIVAKLPHKSHLREVLTNKFIEQLWDSLDHPPLLYMDEKLKYRFADGSHNNPLYPLLGAANQPYARSVKPRIVTLGAMPDPGLVFDSIMGRRAFKKHPNNVSSILWYWATIIIHDLFWTDYRNPTVSKTSAYLDLSPLYGSNQEMQTSIRTHRDGKLKADSFADKRLLGMPPGVCVILIMFNRFHNHVAENLAAINEGGRFTPPAGNLNDEATAEAWKKYDEELFQTARLVTSGLYINITLVDYVRNIVNLNRTNSKWTLDPRQEAGINAGTPDGAEAGTGNVNSAEFNLCYRWHSCISQRDEEWVNALYGKVLGGKKGTMTPREMACALGKFEAEIPDDPAHRTFGHTRGPDGKYNFAGYKRGLDGKFDDDDLVKCIAESIDDCAGSFGARNVPQIMKDVEVMGILHGRKWNVAGLNEFRKHFGLKPYERFEDINSDPEVSEQLRHLYQHPDYVELYPGLVAEEAKKPMSPGVGIAPTYTISRVVLSDAVCLVRGDRYYTTDYNPRHLTQWGYTEVNYDLDVNHGCVFYKLFLRAFPNHFKQNSAWAHYPMVIPGETERILKDLGRDHLFDFKPPKRIAPRKEITSYRGAQHVLQNQDVYRVMWNDGLEFLMGDGGGRFMLAGDEAVHAGQKKCMHALLYGDGWASDVRNFYRQMTETLLVEKSYRLGGDASSRQRHVDLVRDVGNLVHVHFAARVFNLPLKTEKNRKGIFSEHELYQVLAVIFICIFFDFDPAKSFPLRQKALEVTQALGKVVETNVKLATKVGFRGFFNGSLDDKETLPAYGTRMIKGLSKAGLSAHEITWSQVLPTAGAMVPNQAQVFAQAVDYYLDESRKHHVARMHRIANDNPSKENDDLLLGYAMEGVRMAGTFGSYRRAERDDVIVEDNGEHVEIKRGDRVFVSFVDAAKDAEHFPSPEEVDPRRPLESYIHYGLGPHACLGRDISQVALREMFRALFKRKNVRRVPGPQGELKKVARPGGFYAYMTEDWGQITAFPTTMKVMWDE
ncbi:linoleate diol synthase [Colletotrichum musicola]|uniref:Linoleate diol synthase n=1 Tax=Colletotrichum musicola TaxID=2175873 RepID=A0A8H6KWC1_9PEZI|nr:linoleate diol synthase [Colletotrichum musicola]